MNCFDCTKKADQGDIYIAYQGASQVFHICGPCTRKREDYRKALADFFSLTLEDIRRLANEKTSVPETHQTAK